MLTTVFAKPMKSSAIKIAGAFWVVASIEKNNQLMND